MTALTKFLCNMGHRWSYIIEYFNKGLDGGGISPDLSLDAEKYSGEAELFVRRSRVYRDDVRIFSDEVTSYRVTGYCGETAVYQCSYTTNVSS